MKIKIALVVLLLTIALCARGQVYVGGNIGLSSSSGSDRIGIVIAPEIGYSFNQYLTVGSFLSYRSLQNTFGVTPYLRSNLFNVKDLFNFFLSVQAPCRFASGYQSYGAYIRPGVSFQISPGAWLMAHIGAFGYSYTRSLGVGHGGWSARISSNTINIGFCFNI